MFFKQFCLQGLGHASYLVGSEQTGEALLFDPQRQVDGYFAEARMQGLRIRYALDSHGHNDYLSGLAEVADRAEVQLLDPRVIADVPDNAALQPIVKEAGRRIDAALADLTA